MPFPVPCCSTPSAVETAPLTTDYRPFSLSFLFLQWNNLPFPPLACKNFLVASGGAGRRHFACKAPLQHTCPGPAQCLPRALALLPLKCTQRSKLWFTPNLAKAKGSRQQAHDYVAIGNNWMLLFLPGKFKKPLTVTTGYTQLKFNKSILWTRQRKSLAWQCETPVGICEDFDAIYLKAFSPENTHTQAHSLTGMPN